MPILNSRVIAHVAKRPSQLYGPAPMNSLQKLPLLLSLFAFSPACSVDTPLEDVGEEAGAEADTYAHGSDETTNEGTTETGHEETTETDSDARTESSETTEGDSASWDGVTCVDPEGCLAQPANSGDRWVFVVHQCQLDEAIGEGKLVESDGSSMCFYPESPMFPETRCFWSADHDKEVCYNGDGVLWTQAIGACVADDWDISPRSHPWTALACDDLACLGISGSAIHNIRLTEWVEAQQPGELPDCVQ